MPATLSGRPVATRPKLVPVAVTVVISPPPEPPACPAHLEEQPLNYLVGNREFHHFAEAVAAMFTRGFDQPVFAVAEHYDPATGDTDRYECGYDGQWGEWK